MANKITQVDMTRGDKETPGRQTEQWADLLDAAQKSINNNRNDEVENTFCHELMELGLLNEALLCELISDMKLLTMHSIDDTHFRSIRWIILNTMRCFTSHFNKSDLYKIKNLDEEMYAKWSSEYFEELKEILLNLD